MNEQKFPVHIESHCMRISPIFRFPLHVFDGEARKKVKRWEIQLTFSQSGGKFLSFLIPFFRQRNAHAADAG